LTKIINCTIFASTFLAKWKEAEVIPVLKDGDHEEAANNRPLSLLAVASKVCEEIILNQFNAYLTDNKRHYSLNRDLFHIPLYRTATGQRTFAYRGTNIWFNLDNDLKQCVSFKSFKQAIKGQLSEQFLS